MVADVAVIYCSVVELIAVYQTGSTIFKQCHKDQWSPLC